MKNPRKMKPPFQTCCCNSASQRKNGFWVFFRHEVAILAGCRAQCWKPQIDRHVVIHAVIFFSLRRLGRGQREPLFSHRFSQIKHGFRAVRIRENPRRSVAPSCRATEGAGRDCTESRGPAARAMAAAAAVFLFEPGAAYAAAAQAVPHRYW